MLQLGFQRQAALVAGVYLHADHPGLTAFLQQAGDLQARQPEPLADVVLGQPVVVVAPGHARHQLLFRQCQPGKPSFFRSAFIAHS